VKPDATNYFVCPECHGDLSLSAYDSGEVIEGQLACSCGRTYAISRGIPRFVAGEAYTDTFGRQWTRWARTQHDSLNGMKLFRQRFIQYTGRQPESLAGKVVVDAGCGPGAFIDVVQGYAKVVIGFDLSVAIDACYRLHGTAPSVYLAQADIFKPPVRPNTADLLYTFGVVQHTPDPERAFRSLLPLIRPGGEVALWLYRRRFFQPVLWLRRLTAGMPEPKATRFIEWYVPKALAISGLLGRLPWGGHYLRRAVPVADYRSMYKMSPEQHLEWALMDTHDGLITRYTFPQRWRDIERWTVGLDRVERTLPNEIAMVGRIPSDGLCSAGAR